MVSQMPESILKISERLWRFLSGGFQDDLEAFPRRFRGMQGVFKGVQGCLRGVSRGLRLFLVRFGRFEKVLGGFKSLPVCLWWF